MRDKDALNLTKIKDLRYGENPHQKAAIYDVNGDGFPLEFLQGKDLSHTNLLDLDAAWRTANLFEEPTAVVVKHTNPCGAASGEAILDAYIRARDADALAAFGGIIALNRSIDVVTAEAIVSTFVECVIAPGVEDAVRPILAQKPNMRVLTCAVKRFALDCRSVLGVMLVQEVDRVDEAKDPWPTAGISVLTHRQPNAREWEALRFAWRICAGVKSNAVIFTDTNRTLAIGAGQGSRVDSVEVAKMKARRQLPPVDLHGSVVASDAFFPFPDGLEAAAIAGATAVVQPGGSKRDAEVIAAADEHRMAMVFTGRRHFRH